MIQARHRHGSHRWYCCILVIGSLAACNEVPTSPSTPLPQASVTAAPTPSLPPTDVPGSAADKQTVAKTVQQFGDAVSQGNDTVALLMLSPSAQQIVAASDLLTFLGQPAQPRGLDVHEVHLDNDVAVVDCTVRYDGQEQVLRLQLVRLEDVWKINAPVK